MQINRLERLTNYENNIRTNYNSNYRGVPIPAGTNKLLDVSYSQTLVAVDANDRVIFEYNDGSYNWVSLGMQLPAGIAQIYKMSFYGAPRDGLVGADEQGNLILNLAVAEKLDVLFAPSLIRSAIIIDKEF